VHISNLKTLVPGCSTSSEESRDYKFVEIGCTEQKLCLFGAIGKLWPFVFHFKTLYSN
jgi:hypothetical protein